MHQPIKQPSSYAGFKVIFMDISIYLEQIKLKKIWNSTKKKKIMGCEGKGVRYQRINT